MVDLCILSAGGCKKHKRVAQVAIGGVVQVCFHTKKKKKRLLGKKKTGMRVRTVLVDVHMVYAQPIDDWPWSCSIAYAGDRRLSILYTID